jgi:hypothetical protein
MDLLIPGSVPRTGVSILSLLYEKEKDHPWGDMMIELTMTETAKTELLKILERSSAKTIRLIRHGYG